jgi:hypothetical protein
MSAVYCRRVAEGNVDDTERGGEEDGGGKKDSDGGEEKFESMISVYVRPIIVLYGIGAEL